MKEKILIISKKLQNEEITEKEAQKQLLVLFGVSKRILNANDKFLESGCDKGGSYMYFNKNGHYIQIEDVINIINNI